MQPSPGQFEDFWVNFLYRTEITISSISKFIEAANREGDLKASHQAGMNIYDELGRADLSQSHIKLLLDCFNTHGKTVFRLTHQTFKSAAKSALLVPEADEYRQSKFSAFKKSYPFVSGNTLAHELLADPMLKIFRETLFDPFKGYYKTKDDYERAIKYLRDHEGRDGEMGVEEKHGEMAIETALRIYEQNVKNIPKVREGAMAFIAAQSNLWYGVLRKMEKDASNGIIVPAKPEFAELAPKATPTPSPNPGKPESRAVESESPAAKKDLPEKER